MARQPTLEYPALSGAGRSSIEHENCWPVLGFQYAFLGKSGMGIGAARTVVVEGRVDGDSRCSLGEQHLGKKTQKSPAVPVPDHRRHADKGVDDQSSVGKVRQMRLRPCMRGIDLCVGEGMPVVFDDPLPHKRLIEILCDQSFLFFRITPPVYDLRSPQPVGNEAQIGTNDWLEKIGHHDLIIGL